MAEKELHFARIIHGSEEYKKEVALRYKVLREPLGLNFTEEQLDAEDRDTHLVAFLEGKIVACLILTEITPSTIKMRQVAVDSSLQSQGIGGKLVKYSEDYARKEGFSRVLVHARDTAVPFYLKHDYEIIDEPFEEVGIPHRKMTKYL